MKSIFRSHRALNSGEGASRRQHRLKKTSPVATFLLRITAAGSPKRTSVYCFLLEITALNIDIAYFLKFEHEHNFSVSISVRTVM